MAYTIITRHADGGVSREYHKFPACEPHGGGSASRRRRQIFSDLCRARASLRDPKGFSRGKTTRLVACIPPEVYNHVMRNEGREAAGDLRYLIRKSREFGIDPVVSKGRF